MHTMKVQDKALQLANVRNYENYESILPIF